MIDINKTLDLLKLRLYNDYLYQVHVYSEGDSQFHKELTSQAVTNYIDPLNLPLDASILDLGCGPGYFLDEMASRGYQNAIGVTLSADDIALCQSKGHRVAQYDISFLPQSDGFTDESADLIFLRHALEHSPYPIITLMEHNRLLKQNGKIYIEVPAPNNARQHEYNPNHYSILGEHQLNALLLRTGFRVDAFNHIEFDLHMMGEDGEEYPVREHYYAILATKRQCLDIR